MKKQRRAKHQNEYSKSHQIAWDYNSKKYFQFPLLIYKLSTTPTIFLLAASSGKAPIPAPRLSNM